MDLHCLKTFPTLLHYLPLLNSFFKKHTTIAMTFKVLGKNIKYTLKAKHTTSKHNTLTKYFPLYLCSEKKRSYAVKVYSQTCKFQLSKVKVQFLFSAGDWTQGLKHARQALSYTPSPQGLLLQTFCLNGCFTEIHSFSTTSYSLVLTTYYLKAGKFTNTFKSLLCSVSIILIFIRMHQYRQLQGRKVRLTNSSLKWLELFTRTSK